MRSILNLGVAVILAATVVGPATAGCSWGYGAKVGVSISKLYGQSDFTEHRAGFCGGGVLALNFPPNFALQSELLYVVKGGKEAYAADAEVETIAINYLEVPLLAKLIIPIPTGGKPGDSGPKHDSRVYMSLGPALAFKLSESGEVADSTPFKAKGSDLGVAYGAGFEIDLNPGKVVIDFRYVLGHDEIADYSPYPFVKNRSMSITVGYMF